MTRPRRNTAAVLTLLLSLAVGMAAAHRASAQGCPGDSTSTSCSDGGGTGSGGSGTEGGGGGVGPIDNQPDPTATPQPRPVATAEPVAPPAEPRRSGSGGGSRNTSGGGSSGAVDTGGPAATDAQVTAWAQHFGTTADEVKSWFTPYTPNDSLAGAGSGRVVHPGDELTVSNNGAIQDGAAAAGFMDMREGNTIEISLHSTGVPLASAVTDAKGRFSVTVKIPSSTKLGRHFVVALAPNTRQALAAFVFPVSVAEPDPVFKGPVTPAGPTRRSPPWFMIELVLGTALIGGLVLVRVRRGVTARP